MQSVLRMGADGNTIEYQSSMPWEPKFLLSDLSEESVLKYLCPRGMPYLRSRHTYKSEDEANIIPMACWNSVNTFLTNKKQNNAYLLIGQI
jgi:hypothetical protein